MKQHLASFGLIGAMGKRHGTRFVFKPEEIDAVHGNPYFKWRNDDARREYREWLKGPKMYCGECDRYERDPIFLDVERCSKCGELIEGSDDA